MAVNINPQKLAKHTKRFGQAHVNAMQREMAKGASFSAAHKMVLARKTLGKKK